MIFERDANDQPWYLVGSYPNKADADKMFNMFCLPV